MTWNPFRPALDRLEFHGLHGMTVRDGNILIVLAVGENWPDRTRACLNLMKDIAADPEGLESFDLFAELEHLDLEVESIDGGSSIIVTEM